MRTTVSYSSKWPQPSRIKEKKKNPVTLYREAAITTSWVYSHNTPRGENEWRTPCKGWSMSLFMPCLCSPAFLQSGKQNPVSYRRTGRQPTAPRSSSSSPPTLPRKGYPKATWRQTLFRWSPGINQLLPVLPGLSRGKPRATAQGARGRRAGGEQAHGAAPHREPAPAAAASVPPGSAFGRRRGLRSRRPAPTGSNPRSRLRSGRKEDLRPIDGPGRDREGQLRGPQKPIRAGRHPTPSRSR